MPGQILVAVDLSEGSRAAFDAAVRLAADLGAGLVLVHAYAPLPASVGIAGGNLQRDIQRHTGEQQEADAHALTQQWAEVARQQGVTVSVEAEQGDAATYIVEAAQRNEAQMIVVGTHGRSGLARLLMGSVAEQVLRNADRPVLVVPAGPVD